MYQLGVVCEIKRSLEYHGREKTPQEENVAPMEVTKHNVRGSIFTSMNAKNRHRRNGHRSIQKSQTMCLFWGVAS